MIETRFSLDEIKMACEYLLVEEKASLVQHLLSSDLVLQATLSHTYSIEDAISTASPAEKVEIIHLIAHSLVENRKTSGSTEMMPSAVGS